MAIYRIKRKVSKIPDGIKKESSESWSTGNSQGSSWSESSEQVKVYSGDSDNQGFKTRN